MEIKPDLESSKFYQVQSNVQNIQILIDFAGQ